MKKLVLFLFLLILFFVPSTISTSCTSDSDCGSYACDNSTGTCFASCTSDGYCSLEAACDTYSESSTYGLCLSCVDSDGGSADYLNYGTVSAVGRYGRHTYQVLGDTCDNDGLTLSEGSCDLYSGHTNYFLRVAGSCVDLYGSTYVCEDGACVDTSCSLDEDCDSGFSCDVDTGECVAVGTVDIDGACNDDGECISEHCVESVCVECVNNLQCSENYTCYESACIANSCIETDSGLDYENAGSTTGVGYESEAYGSWNDYCSSSTTLIEYYCEDNLMNSAIECVCDSGACTAWITEYDCADTSDDDGDGYTDCADSDCSSDSACVTSSDTCIADASYGACADCIDNDGDGEIDIGDVGCLDGADASEIAYGFQIEQEIDRDSLSDEQENCLNQLSAISCVEDHYTELSWLIAFNAPSEFSSCLDSYADSYFGLSFDSNIEYTKIALADCVYQHNSEFSDELESAFDSLSDNGAQEIESTCFEAYYSEYSSQCTSTESTDDCSTLECGAYVCDTSSDACYDSCSGDDACASGYACTNGGGNVCESDADGDGWVDSEEVVLGDACNSGEDAECAEGHCSVNVCVECDDDLDCDSTSGEICDGIYCTASTNDCSTLDCGAYACNSIVGCLEEGVCVNYQECASGYTCERIGSECILSSGDSDGDGIPDEEDDRGFERPCIDDLQCASGLDCDSWEYYCVECGLDVVCSEGYTCENYQCVSSTASDIDTCVDEDGGDDPLDIGVLTIGEDEYSDSCTLVGGDFYEVEENICDASDVYEYETVNYYCTACDDPSATCVNDVDLTGSNNYVDSDDGEDALEGGYVSNYRSYLLSDGTVFGTEFASSISDRCSVNDEVTLAEKIVSSSGSSSTVYIDCTDYGSSYVCVDGDDGDYCAGTCDESDCNGYACNGDNCYDSCTSDNQCASNAACDNSGMGQNNGECVVCEENDDGLDPEDYSEVVGIYSFDSIGYYTETLDSCFDSSTVTEYYCLFDGSNTVLNYTSYSCLSYGSNYVCDAGECIEGCDESDCNGFTCNRNECYASCTFSGGVSNTAETTECAEDYACSGVSLTCKEDTDEDGWVDSEEVALGETCDSQEDEECAVGTCENFICTLNCEDSDGDEDIYTYGTISGVDEDGVIYEEQPDVCNADNTGVLEYSCSRGGDVTSDTTSCASGYVCEGGVCVVESCGDEDCGEYACNTISDECYSSCSDDNQCESGYACASGSICAADMDGDGWVDSEEVDLGLECNSGEDEECAEGFCDSSNLCIECSEDIACSEEGETCNVDTGICESSSGSSNSYEELSGSSECSSDSDCGTDEVCVSYACYTADCADEIDNDGDDLVDLSDSGCSSSSDNDESDEGDETLAFAPEVKSDGIFTRIWGGFLALLGF